MNKFMVVFSAVLLAIGCTNKGRVPVPSASPDPVRQNVSAPAKLEDGQVVGNGGDHTRSTFIHVGQAVIQYLRENEAGKKLVDKWKLDIEKLEATLTIKRISVQDGVLKDDRGSDVNALVEKGHITLRHEPWLEHFEKERDIYYLVFHEMLRSAGYNDDNTRISDALRPFPGAQRVPTRLLAWLPLIFGDLFTGDIFRKGSIIAMGTGCLLGDVFVDFDAERNILEVSPNEMKATANRVEPIRSRRVGCDFVIPFKALANQKITVTQIDLLGRVKLPVGARALFRFEIFEQGDLGAAYLKDVAAVDAPVHGRAQLRVSDAFSTRCGSPRALRLRSSAQVANDREETAEASIDRLSLYLRMDNCDETE